MRTIDHLIAAGSGVGRSTTGRQRRARAMFELGRLVEAGRDAVAHRAGSGRGMSGVRLRTRAQAVTQRRPGGASGAARASDALVGPTMG